MATHINKMDDKHYYSKRVYCTLKGNTFLRGENMTYQYAEVCLYVCELWSCVCITAQWNEQTTERRNTSSTTSLAHCCTTMSAYRNSWYQIPKTSAHMDNYRWSSHNEIQHYRHTLMGSSTGKQIHTALATQSPPKNVWHCHVNKVSEPCHRLQQCHQF